MNNFLMPIIVLFIFVAVIGFVLWRKKRAKKLADEKAGKGGVGDGGAVQGANFHYTSPKGVNIHSTDEYTTEAQARMFPMIDEGFDEYLLSTDVQYFSGFRKHSDLTIYFVKPHATNQDGTPALVIGGIQAAGTCVGVGGDTKNKTAIVMPFNTEFPEYMQTVVRYESEHIGLDDDWKRRLASGETQPEKNFFYYTGANDVHPIFELPQTHGFAALKSEKSKVPMNCIDRMSENWRAIQKENL